MSFSVDMDNGYPTEHHTLKSAMKQTKNRTAKSTDFNSKLSYIDTYDGRHTRPTLQDGYEGAEGGVPQLPRHPPPDSRTTMYRQQNGQVVATSRPYSDEIQERVRVVEGSNEPDSFLRQVPPLVVRPSAGNTMLESDSEISSVMKTSVASLDSYQQRAMNAIQALDDVVANQQNGSIEIPSTDDERRVQRRRPKQRSSHRSNRRAEITEIDSHLVELDQEEVEQQKQISPLRNSPFVSPTTSFVEATTSGASIPVAPPPPPAPPLPPELFNNNGHQSMQVKRMNWEKIDAPDSNTIWAKVTVVTGI